LPPPRPANSAISEASSFCDDTSTSRDTAFAKIRSRVLGTALAADEIGLG
jgi:5-methyltetrahydropteroyltriglutamate--homocysteine methyltransferase